MEKLATVDLQRYIAQVTGAVPVRMERDAWERRPVPAVILGTPGGNPLVDARSNASAVALETPLLDSQGYLLAERRLHGAPVVFAVGATPEGAVNAVYGLLRELGYGFFLGSEALPDALPERLSAETLVRNPALRTRGVLPWYNFFNSPTTWDPVDHRAFVDSLIRMGANFVGFHTYNNEPFAAYEGDNGEMVWGERLLDTGSPTWGTTPRLSESFAFGVNRLYPHRYFGAATTREFPDDRGGAIRAEQAVMADALAYAKRRGLRTCIGFEIDGDPTNEADRAVFSKRFRHLLLQYPGLEYVWIWQPETIGAQGYRRPSPPVPDEATGEAVDPLLQYAWWRTPAFQRIIDKTHGEPPFFQDNAEGKLARALEGARLEQYARLAERVLRQQGSETRLIVSGWGGDERVLSAEYYEGLDKVLPEQVVFASLDHIIPRNRVDSIYHELPASRERWPIVWLEYDGDLWNPQPFVHTYELLLRDVHRSGSQGVLGIHWRTRELEENFSYLIETAWNPDLTAVEFFRDYARRCYAAGIATEMAALHIALDKLGYRWVGGGGQNECDVFTWGPGESEKAVVLAELRHRAAALLPRSGRGMSRLQWLIDRMDWVLAYDASQHAVVEASARLLEAAASSEEDRQVAAKAVEAMRTNSLATALRAYAQRLSTRGEYGVLATINTKAVPAWERVIEQYRKTCDSEYAEEIDTWSPEPRILVPRFLGSVEAGKAFHQEALVLGGQPAWVHFHHLGANERHTAPLVAVRGWVSSFSIPSKMTETPGFEFSLSFSPDPASPAAFGPMAVTAFPPAKTEYVPENADTRVVPVDATDSPSNGEVRSLPLRVVSDPAFPVVLEWDGFRDADFYRVFRDGRSRGDTAVNAFPDLPPATGAVYRVEAFRDGKVVARSAPLPVVPAPYSGSVPEVSVRSHVGPWGVFLSWPVGDSTGVVNYAIYRTRSDVATTTTEGAGKENERLGLVAARRYGVQRFRDTPPPGGWTYSVAAVVWDGREGHASPATVRFPPEQPSQAVLDLALTEIPIDSKVHGDIRFGETGAQLKGGWIQMPHRPAERLGYGTTVSFEFMADSVAGQPILLCCGFWQTDGWYAQLDHGRFVIRTTAGDAVGPIIEPGTWYHVEWNYNGEEQLLKVNGKLIEPQPRLLNPIPSNRSLRIGQYELIRPHFSFRGTIRNLSILSENPVESTP